MDKVLEYFKGDNMATAAWKDKYQLKDLAGTPMEETPDDMHWRMAKEIGRIEFNYAVTEEWEGNRYENLSEFGKNLIMRRSKMNEQRIIESVYLLFKDFQYIVPQGSIMTMLGNPYKIGSLSNCFVVPKPVDSYGGIMSTDQDMVQLMKRRGGVGTTLDNFRPDGAIVTNAAGSSTGVESWMNRFSNTTREVAQKGRRGALMLLLNVMHPDIFKFVRAKEDLSKVTGANISVFLTDEFIEAAEKDEDFLLRFPVDLDLTSYTEDKGWQESYSFSKYNEMWEHGKGIYFMKIKAKELMDLIIEMAWKNAEPGIAFLDRVHDYSPEGVYELYRIIAANPCAEQYMQAYDACRLIAANLFSMVVNPFTNNAHIDEQSAYGIFYMQQRFADDVVDLELEHIDRILSKIKSDPEPWSIKQHEYDLWVKVRVTAAQGRRTGSGFTGLGDMLAALGYKYDSKEGIEAIERIMKIKMRAELDCTIDMAILRGTFSGWDSSKEFHFNGLQMSGDVQKEFSGKNSFYRMILEEFPVQAKRMIEYGRRNVNWSTVAPTGTVSLMTQTTSGLEPLFLPFYIRRKKINPDTDSNTRVDFTDQNGDQWQEFAVLHPKFKNWIILQMRDRNYAGSDTYISNLGSYHKDEEYIAIIDSLTKDQLQNLFEKSPWYKSTANDINWLSRIKIQGTIQKYTSNAISSTINLPNNVTKEEVAEIYKAAHKEGLKGVTVYRDGSRTGVLVANVETKTDEFGHIKAVKRPKELNADYHFLTSRGRKYAVIVGLLNNKPYEIFAFENPLAEEHLHGKIIKVKKGIYKFESERYSIDNLQLSSEHSDEKLLTRWVSMLLRHGVNPKFVLEQVDKSEVNITNFSRALTRILKKYVPNDEHDGIGAECPQCHEHTLIFEEGCKHCLNCGYSAC